MTTLSVAAVPFVMEATRKLADRCGIVDPERDDIIRTNLSVAYPLGQLGNFFVYLFPGIRGLLLQGPVGGQGRGAAAVDDAVSRLRFADLRRQRRRFPFGVARAPGGNRELSSSCRRSRATAR